MHTVWPEVRSSRIPARVKTRTSSDHRVDDKKTFNKLPYLPEMITRILQDYGFRVDPVSWVAYKVNAFVLIANERALET